MSPREHVRLPLLGDDGTLSVLARQAAAAAPAAAGNVVYANDDDDDEEAQILDAEDAAQFDELGGASPVPEGDDEVDSFFGGDDNDNHHHRVGYRAAVVRWAIVQPPDLDGLSLPELSDGSSSLGDEDEDDVGSLGYLSGEEENEVEEDESEVDEEEPNQEEAQEYLLLYSAMESIVANIEAPDWTDPANDYLLEAYDFAPLQRQSR
ncbi:hypothetical protein V8C44DRAFT_359708 [Trichoderma aethiopicum]